MGMGGVDDYPLPRFQIQHKQTVSLYADHNGLHGHTHYLQLSHYRI